MKQLYLHHNSNVTGDPCHPNPIPSSARLMLDSSGDIKDLAPCVELSELFLDGTLVGGNIRNFRQMRNLSQLSLANCPKIHGRKPEEWETSTLDSRIHNGTHAIQWRGRPGASSDSVSIQTEMQHLYYVHQMQIGVVSAN